MSAPQYKYPNSVIIIMESMIELTELIKKCAGNLIPVIESKYTVFGNNEISAYPLESVRAKTVFIIGTGSNINGSINDHLIGLYSMIRACRDASAKSIITLCAYLPYSRSDKKDQSRTPIMAKLVCDFIKKAGSDRLVSIDLHAAQIQGFFDGPYDNLYATTYLIDKITSDKADQILNENIVVVSPDAGGIKRIQDWASRLNCQYTFLSKTRDHFSISKIVNHELVHCIDFTGKSVLMVDDIGDTFGTLCSAATILKEKGAENICAVVTHGIFSKNAIKLIEDSCIDTVYVSNTLPQGHIQKISTKIVVVDISQLFIDAIMCCINATSMSALFEY